MLTLAASAGIAMPASKPAGAGARVVRSVGLYIAGSAAAIQLLDVLADRLDLPEHFFIYAIILAVIGLPVTAAGAAVFGIAAAENARPRGRSVERAKPRQGRSGGLPVEQQVASPVRPGGDAADPADDASALLAKLELAMSYRRIARLHDEQGDPDAARHNYTLFLEHVTGLDTALRPFVEEARRGGRRHAPGAAGRLGRRHGQVED